jgi:hypothetical protein
MEPKMSVDPNCRTIRKEGELLGMVRSKDWSMYLIYLYEGKLFAQSEESQTVSPVDPVELVRFLIYSGEWRKISRMCASIPSRISASAQDECDRPRRAILRPHLPMLSEVGQATWGFP